QRIGPDGADYHFHDRRDGNRQSCPGSGSRNSRRSNRSRSRASFRYGGLCGWQQCWGEDLFNCKESGPDSEGPWEESTGDRKGGKGKGEGESEEIFLYI